MIYKKLAKIQGAINGLTKNANAGNYSYIDGNKCLGAIRPMMVENGLILMPEVADIESRVITYKVWNRDAMSMIDKTEALVTLKMRMTWVDSEDGETIAQEWAGTGQNMFDKGFGSALTYGERYYLLKLFHIPTDCDDVDYLAAARDSGLAEAQAMQSRAFQPLDEETYWKIVNNEAFGQLSKEGTPYRQAYQAYTNAGEEQMRQFDHDVQNVRIANMQQAQ